MTSWIEELEKKKKRVAELSERRVSKGKEAVEGPNALISKKKKPSRKDQAGFSVKPRM
jgi:CRISPR/Cas system CSM-associated protein Csm4 (group 5 of RAMP superfamily)